MSSDQQHQSPARLLVVMPSWVGDIVMATPTLRALRQLYPSTDIVALAPEAVRPVIEACPWLDQILAVRPDRSGVFATASRLRAERFDMAVLLPNSFRWALVAKLAGIGRIAGYSRDGRGLLLTERLTPRREGRRFVPVPALDYYLQLTVHLGSVEPAKRMELFTRPEDDVKVDRLLGDVGSGRKLVLLAPGANYGPSKMWPADRFAALADRCVRELGAKVVVSGAPGERPILDQVIDSASEPVIDLAAAGIDLALLKSVVKRSSLVVTNDTGPRHVAAAFGIPLVTIFGPTDPAWTEIGFELERQVKLDVPCAPCQKKRCPTDLCCMIGISADMVFEKAAELLAAERRSGQPDDRT